MNEMTKKYNCSVWAYYVIKFEMYYCFIIEVELLSFTTYRDFYYTASFLNYRYFLENF